MNIYLVERTDKIGWDEFISAVIIAEDENMTVKLARHELSGEYINGADSWNNAKITKIGVADSVIPTVIHSSFNAG